MNKAFVRESDATDEHCPECGSIGQAVPIETVLAHLPPDAKPAIAVTANFCPHATCDVAYFDVFERVVRTSELTRPVYPKDPDAPICPCFGVTCSEIDADIAEGEVTRTKALLERAKSDERRCETAAPNGRSCIAEVQRYFMQRRAGG